MALARPIPMLHVADVRRSLSFYRDRLGFTLLSSEDLLESVCWGHRMKEFYVLDPDGHMLTFRHETDEPPTPEEE